MIQKIAVYCGTATGNSPVYVKAATDLGQYLADHRRVVYGGGSVGLMAC